MITRASASSPCTVRTKSYTVGEKYMLSGGMWRSAPVKLNTETVPLNSAHWNCKYGVKSKSEQLPLVTPYVAKAIALMALSSRSEAPMVKSNSASTSVRTAFLTHEQFARDSAHVLSGHTNGHASTAAAEANTESSTTAAQRSAARRPQWAAEGPFRQYILSDVVLLLPAARATLAKVCITGNLLVPVCVCVYVCVCVCVCWLQQLVVATVETVEAIENADAVEIAARSIHES